MKIQCSVPILTLNSGKTLERLFLSLKNFDDVYLVDGNSTDNTHELAKKYSIPIYKQVETEEPNIRIENFVEIRNRSYGFAKHSWIFDIDSDEYITEELEKDIRHIVEGGDINKVCHIQKFPLLEEGQIVRHAFFIPDYYPRLFNLRSGIHYNSKKMVHEQMIIPEGAKEEYFKNAVISSWPPYEKCIEKDNYYLGIMRKKRPQASPYVGLRIAAINFLKATKIGVGSLLIYLKHPKDSLPLNHVWRFVRYHLILSKDIIMVIKSGKVFMKEKEHKIYMPENHMDKLYHSKNPFVRYVHLNRLHKIVVQLPKGDNLRILDAGCGEGHLIQAMHKCGPDINHIFYGVDIIDIALEKARQRCPYAILHKNNLTKTEFPDEYFDVVICTEVLEHIKEYNSVVSEIKRVLKPGGYFIITFPNEILWTIARFFLGRRPIKVSDHINLFYPKTMRRLLFDMEPVILKKLPFDLPLFMALGSLMKFKKQVCCDKSKR